MLQLSVRNSEGELIFDEYHPNSSKVTLRIKALLKIFKGITYEIKDA